MEYTWRYRNSLNSVFTSRGECDTDSSLDYGLTFDEHNVFNRMLVVDVSSDEVEVPMVAKAIVEHVVTDNLIHSYNTQKVVIPLYVNSRNQSRRAADSIVNEFFTRTYFRNRLQRVTTNKGEIYYGNRGIILDKDFKPLILCSIVCKKVEERGMTYMDYYKPIIRVSPEVFLNETGLINKSILKKIIPFYLTHDVGRVNTYDGKFRSKIPENTKPQILIEDISRFIETPAIPNPNTCSNEALNKLLLDNIDDVLMQMR